MNFHYFVHLLCVMYQQQTCNQRKKFSHNVEMKTKIFYYYYLFIIIRRIPTNLVMFFEYLPEACEVQGLVVLQQDQAEIELAERQLEVVQRA